MASVPKYRDETRWGGVQVPGLLITPLQMVAEFSLNRELYVHAGSTRALSARTGEVYLQRARVSFSDVSSKHVILSSSVLF